MLSPQWLDELRARVTLSSVIMRTTKLQKAGREWKACCPFHNEKTPSFTVSDEKGFYHCFGCGAHGDVIRWMTDQRGLEFMDAVKEAGTGFAFPSMTAYMGRDDGLDPQEMREAEERVAAWREQGELPFPNFSEDFRRERWNTGQWPPPGSPDER